MDSPSFIKYQIEEILNQAEQNDRDCAVKKNVYKNKICNLNVKISKAVLKSIKTKLLQEKKEIVDDYLNWLNIEYRCEQNIQN